MAALDWDKLTEAQKVAHVRARKLKGHTSVAEHDRLRIEAAREGAYNHACDLLLALGFAEAATALEAVVFEGAAQ